MSEKDPEMNGEKDPEGANSSISRRGLLKGAVAGGVALAGGGLLGAVGGGAGAFAAGLDYPSHPKWHFVFVNHVTTNPFFVPTIYGIEDACRLVGCSYSWTGSKTSQVSTMLDAIEAAIASHADGIATSIIAPKSFDAPIKRAIAAGIPVIAYNATVSPDPAMAYVGQDLYEAGVQMGKRILKAVPRGSHIGLFIATPGTANIQPRMNGAIAAIKAAGNPITYDVVATGALVSQELSTVQSWYLGHQTAKGMYAVDAGSTQSVAQVMQQHKLPAKGWHAGGFDLLPLTLKLIKENYLDFTIDQQPYEQGFYPLLQLYLYKLSGSLMYPSSMETGLKFITKATVDPYLKRASRFEGSTSKELDLATK